MSSRSLSLVSCALAVSFALSACSRDPQKLKMKYLANGDKSYSKERVEVFGGGAVAALEDFRRLETVRGGKKKVSRSILRQDKGHRGEWEAFVTSLRFGGESPIPLAQIVNTMMATFALEESRTSGRPVAVGSLAETTL